MFLIGYRGVGRVPYRGGGGSSSLHHFEQGNIFAKICVVETCEIQMLVMQCSHHTSADNQFDTQ